MRRYFVALGAAAHEGEAGPLLCLAGRAEPAERGVEDQVLQRTRWLEELPQYLAPDAKSRCRLRWIPARLVWPEQRQAA